MRNRLELQLCCSKHPQTRLNMTTELSKIGASSGYEVDVKIAVHPCRNCEQELYELQHAVAVFGNVAKEIDERNKKKEEV